MTSSYQCVISAFCSSFNVTRLPVVAYIYIHIHACAQNQADRIVIGNLIRPFLFDIPRLQLSRPFGVLFGDKVFHVHEHDEFKDLYDYDTRPGSIVGVTIDDEGSDGT